MIKRKPDTENQMQNQKISVLKTIVQNFQGAT